MKTDDFNQSLEDLSKLNDHGLKDKRYRFDKVYDVGKRYRFDKVYDVGKRYRFDKVYNPGKRANQNKLKYIRLNPSLYFKNAQVPKLI